MVPIWSAAIAYFVYQEKLQINHYIGMAMLFLCMTFISLSNFVDKDTLLFQPPPDSTLGQTLLYRPITSVLSALLATILLGINMNVVKYFDKQGFPADVFAYTCYGASNLLQAIVSIIYFYEREYNSKYFLFGFIGSFLNTLGLVCVALAVSSGLSGPSSALVNL